MRRSALQPTAGAARPRHHRWFVVALAVLAIVGAATLSPAGPASAHTSGGAATGGGQWHPWPSDGCTKVPNTVPGVFNFTHACQHHDGCYVRRFSSSRSTCDSWFLNDMNASCRTSSTLSLNRSRCYAVANVYYLGVRACGDYSWRNRAVSTPVTKLCW